MGRETDGQSPVDIPDEAAQVSSGGTPDGTRWPTWEDIARLHSVPGAAGSGAVGVVRQPERGADEPEPAQAAEDDSVEDGPVDEVERDEHVPGDDEPEESVAGEPVAEESAEVVVDDEPVADELALDEPPADDAAADEPVPEDTTTDEPVAGDHVAADEPAADGTAAEDTAPDEPTAGEPTVDDTAPDEAAADDHVADEPETGEQPADEPVTNEPVADDRTADGLVSDEPVADEPTAGEAAVDEPTADDPAVDEPTADDPAADEPPPGPVVGDEPVDQEDEPATVADDATVVLAPVTDVEPDTEPEPETSGTDGDDARPATTGDDATVVMAPVPEAEPQPEPEMEPAAEREPEPAAGATVVLAPVAPPAPAPPPAPPVPAPTPVPAPAPAAPERVSAFPATSSAPAASPRVTAGPVPVPEREPHMLDEFRPDDRRRHWPRNLAIAAGVVVLLGGGYVAASYAMADRVPRGATVAGVDIGGLASADAVERLTSELATTTGGPLTVTANDVQAEIDPVTAGLSFDAQATVDALTGLRLTDPAQLWRQVVGIGEVEPVTAVDESVLEAAVTAVSGSLRAEPVNGTIVFADGSPHATPATDGWQLDVDAAVRQIAGSWLVAAQPLVLPTTVVQPDVTQAETEQVLADVAQHVSGGPVSVVVGDRTATLPAPLLSANASFVPQDGTLALQMDGQPLADAVLTQLPDLLTPAADARFEFQDDAPVIVPGVPGTRLDPAQVSSAVAAAAAKATDRTAELELVPTDPAESTAELEALGITQPVYEFSTPLTSDKIRDINIRQGMANLTGVLVRPGEEFSLTEALGPIDSEHGFVKAGAIVNGEHTDAWGGGLSQVSTTTYNAAYFVGYEIVEHHPHSEYFSRYPEGREATIFTGTLDMRWKNNTPYGALLQGWVANGRVYMRIWSTPYWRVESETSGRSAVRAPTTVYSQSPTCSPQSAGNPGFTVTVTRRTYLGDQLSKTDKWTTTYRPQNQVVCGPPPAETPPAG